MKPSTSVKYYDDQGKVLDFAGFSLFVKGECLVLIGPSIDN
jgi:hypothetical protein